MNDKLHRAAKDGYLDPLNRATKKELNTADEEGMTPTLWAAHRGQLNALQVCCSRGGDPNKCDFIGNSSLHFAARNGYMNCLTFLLSFGVNIWHMDNDSHTALDIAGLWNHKECMRILDEAIEKEMKGNEKKVEKLKQKAKLECDKRCVTYEKIQKKLQSTNYTRSISGGNNREEVKRNSKSQSIGAQTFTQATQDVKNKNSLLQTIRLKTRHKKPASYNGGGPGEFRISEEGRKTVTSLPGFQSKNSTNVMYKPSDTMVSDDRPTKRKTIPQNFLPGPASTNSVSAGFGTGLRWTSQPTSMYASMQPGSNGDLDTADAEWPVFDYSTISSSRSMMQRNGYHGNEPSYDDDLPTVDLSPIDTFLASLNLSEYAPNFKDEKMDMDALMLCTEKDLKEMHLELGPRKKILSALEERKNSMNNDTNLLLDTKF